jgi:hypothetical protein
MTPYNTGKVKIGETVYLNKFVTFPYVETDADMLELQSYLLYDPSRLNRSYWIKRVYVAFTLFVLLILLLAN